MRQPSWWAAIQEFDGALLQGFSTFGFDDNALGSHEVFEQWLGRERRSRVTGQDGFVPATVWWIVDDAQPERVLGSIHLRHEMNDLLLAEGGHIGYAVRPTARGRGVATQVLSLALDEARKLQLERVLVVCDADNESSQRTILTAGGILENAPGKIQRYWIRVLKDAARQ